MAETSGAEDAEASETGARVLAALGCPHSEAIPFRTAVVVAHPDDETIGCGAQLPRFPDPIIVHVTDGAPRSGHDAAAKGLSVEAYANARRREVEAAAAFASVAPEALVGLGIPDQEASANLAALAHTLTALLRDREAVFTHAYEGGHPDHDAVAFAVHAAARLLARENGSAPVLIEMPFYHDGAQGWTRQSFADEDERPSLLVPLGRDVRERKARMMDAHVTQAAVLADFARDAERFRAAPAYDFTRLPNGGRLLYEARNWGMTGARWTALAREALAELGLDRA